MKSYIEFSLNGEIIRLSDIRPDTTLLNWLRLDAQKTGTKEGCAEGDCGACTVFMRLKRPDVTGGFYDEMRAVNACILFMPMLDGAIITTVEGIAGPDGTLHPVQQAMIENHGAQCGFCTPGFITSLYHLWRSGSDFSEAQIEDGLAGNLCRCTGYGPIVTAAKALRAYEIPNWEHDRILAEDAFLTTAISASEPLEISCDGMRFYAPTDSAQAARLYAENNTAYILSGGTDIGLWVTKQHRELSCFISTGRLRDCAMVTKDKGGTLIGANVTHNQAMTSMTDMPDALYEVWRRFGSAQVRATGTVCGNIANGSPIGDLSPCFLALDGSVTLLSPAGERTVSLDDFFISYGVQDRQDDEFVSAVFLPDLPPNHSFHAYKISKRFDQDISAVLMAMRLEVVDEIITNIRLAFGGMAATPKRALVTEKALVGRNLSDITSDELMAVMAQDFTPLSDMRASSSYRLQVASNLIRKAFIADSDPNKAVYLAGGS